MTHTDVQGGALVPIQGDRQFLAFAGEERTLLADVVIAKAVTPVVDGMLVEELGVPVAGLGLVEAGWILPVRWIGQDMTVNGGAKLRVAAQHPSAEENFLGGGFPGAAKRLAAINGSKC